MRKSEFLLVVVALSLSRGSGAVAEERFQGFDTDPGWDGHQNRSSVPPREVRQDFGYRRSHHAGGEDGEIGGRITPAGEPAWYARRIPTASFDDRLTASGKLAGAGRQFHVLYVSPGLTAESVAIERAACAGTSEPVYCDVFPTELSLRSSAAYRPAFRMPEW